MQNSIAGENVKRNRINRSTKVGVIPMLYPDDK